MTPAARLAAAIDVLTEIEGKKRPAPDALREWGQASWEKCRENDKWQEANK